ncbi:MAG TPA: TonB family protein [Cytophagaceae bacterium]
MEHLEATTLDEIVFENRNKAYGAYLLRKLYGKHVGIAVTLSVIVFTLALISPKIYSRFFPEPPVEQVKITEVDLTMLDVPPLDKETPKPPPINIEPPKIEIVKFLPPDIKPDEQVIEEEEIVDQAVLDTAATIGEINQVGEDDLGEVLVIGDGSEELGTGEDEIFTYVEEVAGFPGGLEAFYKFLQKNIVYPRAAMEMEVQGRVIVQFVVEKDGSVTDVKVLKGLREDMDNEAVRVVSMMPKWTPAKMNGKPVRFKTSIPIVFKLVDN